MASDTPVVNSLYERIGGEAAVDAAVQLFYDKVIADESLKHFFEGIEMERLLSHQKAFLSFAFGGPNDYTGRSMRGAHQRLVTQHGLNETHYDKVVGHLAASLAELGVASELIDEVAIIAGAVKVDVLNL